MPGVEMGKNKLKKKKGFVMSSNLVYWIVAAVILIVVVVLFIFLRQKNVSALEFIKNLFKFRR